MRVQRMLLQPAKLRFYSSTKSRMANYLCCVYGRDFCRLRAVARPQIQKTKTNQRTAFQRRAACSHHTPATQCSQHNFHLTFRPSLSLSLSLWCSFCRLKLISVRKAGRLPVGVESVRSFWLVFGRNHCNLCLYLANWIRDFVNARHLFAAAEQDKQGNLWIWGIWLFFGTNSAIHTFCILVHVSRKTITW